MNSSDDMMTYALGALAVGGALSAVGLAMYVLAKKSDSKPVVYPFYKDDNPTRETKLPNIDGRAS